MSNKTFRNILQTIQNDGIKLQDLKTRAKLRETVETMKCIVVDGESKNDRAIVEKVMLGAWKILGDQTDYLKISDDMGYPISIEELGTMVAENRLERYGVESNLKEYMKYLTQGEYKIEKRDWYKYKTGEDKENPVETINSTFFVATKDEKKSKATLYRQAVCATRQVMAVYLQDDHVKETFFTGGYKSWADFEKKIAIVAGLGDGVDDHDPISTYREKLKKVMNGTTPPRQKYAALSSLVKKYFVHKNGDILNPVWEDDKTKFKGPDNQITPAMHMLLINLACMDMKDEDFEKIEKEFKRVNTSFSPETVSEKRPHLLQLITQPSVIESTAVRAVRENQETLVAKCEEIEDFEDLDDQIFEQMDTGVVAALLEMRNRKFPNQMSTRRRTTNRFNRFQNFARMTRGQVTQQRTQGQGQPFRGQRNANARAPQAGQSKFSDKFLNKMCRCQNNEKLSGMARYHKIRDCPLNFAKSAQSVNQVEENTPQEALEHEGEMARSQIGL